MSTCRKIRYKDELGAKIALASTQQPTRKAKREEKSVYRCSKCKDYHLTKQVQKSSKNASKR